MLQTAAEPRTSETLSSLAMRIAERRQVTPKDVLALRQSLYADGMIDRGEAQVLLTLEHAIERRHPAWDELYVEALTDHFRSGASEFDLDEAEVAFLKEGILENGSIADPTELRLLLNLVFHARSCPDDLVVFTREAVAHSISTSSMAMFGEGTRTAGAVDGHDVQAIRRLIYGTGGKGGMTVQECEASWLVGIDHATDGAGNDPAWRDLFVKAVAMYLLLAGPSPDAIDASEVDWLERHLKVDEKLTVNGEALLDYLVAEASRIDPSFARLRKLEPPPPPPHR
ncbi:MAG: hypothetical protein R3C97_13270 [Geminicoccaceae bacterium]